MKYFLFSLLILFIVLDVSSQAVQKGGFTYGWDKYSQDDLEGLGSRSVFFDSTDLVDIVHAPAVGVHPRVYFGPSEIPEIIDRLENTNSGAAVRATIHAYTTLLHLGSNYNQNSTYALDEQNNRHIDNSGAWNMEPYFSALKAGDSNVWEGVSIKSRHRTAALMSLEAFMCLLYPNDFDEDVKLPYSERISDLGLAMHFWATLALDDPEVNPNSINFNNFGGTHMALCYDLMYNYLTENQRDTIRLALSKIIPNRPRHGGGLHAFVNTSNWSTLNSFEIITNLAIEGEAGYQEVLTEEWMRALHTFINYGWYPSGAGYEGLGKNYQFVTTMIAAAKRGYSLLGHPHVRAYGESFLPAITQPFGKGFTSYDVWGGSGYDPVQGQYKFNSADAVGLKWTFPESNKIDFVWRNYIGSFYQNNSTDYVYAQIVPDDSYNNYLIPAAVFCADYDSSISWQQHADATLAEDYVAKDRGLAVFKSSSSREALALQFHARQDMGGHTHGDRLDFTLSGLERIWIRKSYGGSQFQPSQFHSMVLVDDLGVGVSDPDGVKCRQPARLLNYNIDDELSQISADATYAYTWEWHWSGQTANNDHPWLGNDGWEKVNETWNDFQYETQEEDHFDIPFYQFPHWHQEGRFERMIKRKYNPVEKVVRNIGMLKGDYPVALVIDDIKKDDDTHNYKWVAQIANDLELDSYDVQLSDQDFKCDIILKEPESTGYRKLLIRVLENANYNGKSAPGIIDTLEYFDYFSGNAYNPNPNWVRKRLVIESEGLSPNFKVLLFPFEEGDELPITNWNPDKDTLHIVFPDEEKFIHFYKNAEQNTQFELVEGPVNTIDFVDQSDISLFPNPAGCAFSIKSKEPILGLELFDAQGKLVYCLANDGNSNVRINTDQLSSGQYYLKLNTQDAVHIKKMIIKQCD